MSPADAAEPPLDFFSGLIGRESAVLRAIREDAAKRGAPSGVGPDAGQVLHLLASACGARRAVAIGARSGYSACWLARALPGDGLLRVVERDARRAGAARASLARAGLSAKAVVLEGPGVVVLPTLERLGPFDLCFIDADRSGSPAYARWAAANLRSGGLVVHRDARAAEAGAEATRECLRLLADESLFSSCAAIPVEEGMAVAVRR